jgi:beta-galactosidase
MKDSTMHNPRHSPRDLVIVLLVLFLALSGDIAAAGGARPSRLVTNINPVWRFELGDPAGKPSDPGFNDTTWDVVSLPHTHEIFPSNLDGFLEHGRNVGWYRRELLVPSSWTGKKIFLEFHGAMQSTKLWVNGAFIGEYAVSGYDSFHFDITAHVKIGKNLLAVRVDNTVNPDLPPDGRKTDYIQFGGLYRDVNVVVTDPVHLTFPWEAAKAGVRLTLPEVSESAAVLTAESTIRNESANPRNCTIVTEVRDREGKIVTTMSSTQVVAAGSESTFLQTSRPIAKPHLWSPDDPYLYRVNTIVQAGANELDRLQTNLGIRWCRFDKEQGFFLNGKHLKLVGANRHQTWPFIGNALPAGLHRRDAEQIKNMGCNWIRLSHYPHDPKFLDDLDELGLMALAEGPTWMGEGNAKWMENLDKSFRSMIRRDRNHPCIIIWNACINHGDAHPMLVNAAGEEDPTRPRGQSDVPCLMDFHHNEVSGNGALTIEHTGHTHPVIRGSGGDYGEYSLAQQHWEQTNAAYLVPGNSGLAVWAMYDYNTFHNCDGGIAKDGVCDLFHIPKVSYWWHQSELTSTPMTYIIPANNNQICVFSNCEQVRLLRNNGSGFQEIAVQKPDTGFALKHPPFHFQMTGDANGLKAEGLIGGKVVASNQWLRAGTAVALTLEADRPIITADGSDISRIIATAVDSNGTPVTSAEIPVTFALKGLGQLIGENPTKLRAGKMIILVQSAFVPGEIAITASADGLKPALLTLKTQPIPAGVDMPTNMPAKQPTRSNRLVIPGQTEGKDSSWLAFPTKADADTNAWVEGGPIMIPGTIKEAPIGISGGEYRIYTSPWTSKPGKVIGGDAVYVRVKTGPKSNAKQSAELTINQLKTRFEVITR